MITSAGLSPVGGVKQMLTLVVDMSRDKEVEMKRLVTNQRKNTFRPCEARLHDGRIYAATDECGKVCVLIPRKFESCYVRPLVLEDLSTLNTYFNNYEPIEDALRKLASWDDWGDVYEFENLIEFLEWALEQEKKR